MIDLYRKMVDENLVRRDISFGEMASWRCLMQGKRISRSVMQLYDSALKQKRRYIRHFATMLEALDGAFITPRRECWRQMGE